MDGAAIAPITASVASVDLSSNREELPDLPTGVRAEPPLLPRRWEGTPVPAHGERACMERPVSVGALGWSGAAGGPGNHRESRHLPQSDPDPPPRVLLPPSATGCFVGSSDSPVFCRCSPPGDCFSPPPGSAH